MGARILDGKRIAQELLERVSLRVAERAAQGLPTPGLAVVLVGSDAGSSVYVRNKRKACHQVGFRSFDYDLPASTTQDELIALIDRLNADPHVHGILVQSPLPEHIDEDALVDRIDPGKDVDGFQAINVGRLALRRFGLRPCTPHVVSIGLMVDRLVHRQRRQSRSHFPHVQVVHASHRRCGTNRLGNRCRLQPAR
jgi:methylenetetrahydrofolate dehydrogenase (NADP+)/methenyltetrahydrofolate cyclohydrolase